MDNVIDGIVEFGEEEEEKKKEAALSLIVLWELYTEEPNIVVTGD